MRHQTASTIRQAMRESRHMGHVYQRAQMRYLSRRVGSRVMTARRLATASMTCLSAVATARATTSASSEVACSALMRAPLLAGTCEDLMYVLESFMGSLVSSPADNLWTRARAPLDQKISQNVHHALGQVLLVHA